MMIELGNKVTAVHLKRTAYLYVRQSTLRQVVEHTESTKRQYALKQRAVQLGWRAEQISVIDSDLGESGASMVDRDGFQKLVAEVSMGRAGIVLGLEVSRLARNSADWHRLLELCAFNDTLILDEDGIYNPAVFNDRLLLGLKGTMSEAELHVMRMRMIGGVLTKARRGELCPLLPIGLVYGQENSVVLDPDQQVQECIRLIFSLFHRTGSAYALVRHFRNKGLLFPQRPLYGPNRHELIWVPLQRSTVMRVLNNPRYAGAYFFGRTRGRRRPEGGRPISSKAVPREQWHALIRQAHPGYITWEIYEDNLRKLEENSRAHQVQLKVPPREGPALLQGMAICGNCGRRMSIRYHWRGAELVPDYLCQYQVVERLEKACMSIPGANVDAVISCLLAEAVTPVALEVSLAVQQELLSRLEEVDRLRLKQVERARYEANLAQRRYMQVEPENRLVADTLEAEWNHKLQVLAEARLEYERQRSLDRQLLDEEKRDRIMALASDFPRIWNDPKIPARERKRMVALMIEDVTLTRGTEISMHVRFKGGLTRTLVVPLALNAWKKYMTAPAVLAEIDRLLNEHTDAEVATILNGRGLASGRRMKFTGQIIGALRKGNHLKSRYERLRERGMLDVLEMAALLGASMRTIYVWHRQGRLRPHRYNDSGAYLYEAPEAGSPLLHSDRKYRRGKNTGTLVHSTNNEVQYEA
jgi:DNA invertase Pin-like site-specific DNA recombinase